MVTPAPFEGRRASHSRLGSRSPSSTGRPGLTVAFTAACARDICRSVRSRRQLDRPGVIAGRRNITSVAASEARKMPTPRRRACCHFHLPSAVIRIEPCLLTKEFLPNNDMARSACRVSVSSREPTASTARQLRLRHSTAHVKQDDRPAVNKGRAHSEPPILQHHVIWCQGRLRCSIPSRRVKFRKVWRHPRRPPYERATSSARTLPWCEHLSMYVQGRKWQTAPASVSGSARQSGSKLDWVPRRRDGELWCRRSESVVESWFMPCVEPNQKLSRNLAMSVSWLCPVLVPAACPTDELVCQTACVGRMDLAAGVRRRRLAS